MPPQTRFADAIRAHQIDSQHWNDGRSLAQGLLIDLTSFRILVKNARCKKMTIIKNVFDQSSYRMSSVSAVVHTYHSWSYTSTDHHQ